MISVQLSAWLTDVTNSYNEDLKAHKIIEGITNGGIGPKQYSYHKGVIKKGNQIYIDTAGGLRDKLMAKHHDTGIGGHSGRDATHHKIKQFFVWPNMKNDVSRYVKRVIFVKEARLKMLLTQGYYTP